MDLPEEGRAAKAGLKDGDIITEINHKGLGSPADFKTALQQVDTEKDVILVVRRKSKEVILVIKAANDDR
jgi:S1-C subfamily serine protease